MKDAYRKLGRQSREWGSKSLKQESRASKATLRKLTKEEEAEVAETVKVRACPNHPDRVSAGPSTNLCGDCLFGRKS